MEFAFNLNHINVTPHPARVETDILDFKIWDKNPTKDSCNVFLQHYGLIP